MTTTNDRPPALLGVLADDTRWRMYHELRRAGQPLTRRQIAGRVGVSARLAAFHLEQLLEAGLLTAHYERPAGRSGPGAGRSAKHYAPAAAGVAVTIPERRYEFVGGLLLDALWAAGNGDEPIDAARHVAAERGRDVGREAHAAGAGSAQGDADREVLVDVLAALGYEPALTEWGDVRLGNCPFHVLAQRSPEVVCAINQVFLQGVLEGLGRAGTAVLACCRPGDCCVLVSAAE